MDKNWCIEWIWRVNNEKGLVLKLKFQYSRYLTKRADSMEKDADAGND